jgi:predicted aspartyl protease
MLVNILKLSAFRSIKIGQNEQPSKIIKKVKTGQTTYMAVTRELVHSIPTQPPQGSKPVQSDGVFVQLLCRAFKATAASKIKVKCW